MVHIRVYLNPAFSIRVRRSKTCTTRLQFASVKNTITVLKLFRGLKHKANILEIIQITIYNHYQNIGSIFENSPFLFPMEHMPHTFQNAKYMCKPE